MIVFIRDHTFVTPKGKAGGWGGGLEICHVFEDSVVFKQCMFFIFADGGHRIGHVLSFLQICRESQSLDRSDTHMMSTLREGARGGGGLRQ